MALNRQLVTVLGATGSIGSSTLSVIEQHPERYQTFALTANSRLDELVQLCHKFTPRYTVVATAEDATYVQKQLVQTQVLHGAQGLVDVASHPDVDMVMAAIVGAAGLEPTLAAVKAGKKILLANKEALVMTGALFMQAVKQYGATLLPIDSEHNAIFQSLPANYQQGLANVGVRRILLTASGGPFRERDPQTFSEITPEQACKHPNWSMGRKISVDSATLMNKGLELIEACWLFDTTPDQVEVVVHPQSVIHSMVDYVDGSVLAQLGNPDMRTPIAQAMAWPERISSGVKPLNIFDIARFDFYQPDEQAFPCLTLARQAFAKGGTAPAILNAANEVAVDAFLHGKLNFVQIAQLIAAVLNQLEIIQADTLDTVLTADKLARDCAQTWIMEHQN